MQDDPLKTNNLFDVEKIADFYIQNAKDVPLTEWMQGATIPIGMRDAVVEKISEKTPMEYGRYDKRTSAFDDTDEQTSECYLHNSAGIWLIKIKEYKDRKGNEHTVEHRDKILKGDLRILSRVEFLEQENKEPNWICDLDGKRIIGSHDDILDEIKCMGRVIGGLDDFRRAVSMIISNTRIERVEVYPATGMFWNKEKQKPVVAITSKDVYPSLASQETVLKMVEYSYNKEYAESPREVAQASADLISSMPDVNKLPALCARGFATLAPLAYEIKKSIIGVYPYLYLYGERGSSKTHLAIYSATRTFGEIAPLNSESVDSSFRLGMEFTATTFPRVIDEAQDIFQKNIPIFKAAATSTLATKRGNKDKTMDEYQAFCTFILTSNSPPIQPEEDIHGAISDRVLILECKYDKDFSGEAYVKATKVLDSASVLLGKLILAKLQAKLGDGGINWLLEEIMRLSKIIQKEHNTSLRRSYCLAELVVGVKLYYEILDEMGVIAPIPFIDEAHLITAMCDKIVRKTNENEKMFAVSFTEWADAVKNRPDAAMCGIFTNNDGEILITSNAIKAYRKQFQFKSMPVNDLPSLALELNKLGYMLSPSVNKDFQNKARWSIKLLIFNELTEVTTC